MRLFPVSSPELVEQIAAWLSDERIYVWLDFGNGSRPIDAAGIRVMLQNDRDVVRAVFVDQEPAAIGVVALANVDVNFKAATLWIAIGDRRYTGRGYALRACAAMLAAGFHDLKLDSVDIWAVECNPACRRIAERLGFRLIGRQRNCHLIDGRAHDRLLYSLAASEFAQFDADRAFRAAAPS
jgi:RimJ/RimL family protein N-acetyltransferase